jgi:hypothetical protein
LRVLLDGSGLGQQLRQGGGRQPVDDGSKLSHGVLICAHHQQLHAQMVDGVDGGPRQQAAVGILVIANGIHDGRGLDGQALNCGGQGAASFIAAPFPVAIATGSSCDL